MRSAGFTEAPEVLGIDERGREVLRWIEGEPGVAPIRPEVASDEPLVALARMIRRFHDASASFRWDKGGWQELLRDPSGSDEIVCHNDLSTYNVIYRAGPVAIVDWELAAPGSRLWDLAYACWWLVPLHRPEYCERVGWGEVDQPRRLRLFVDAYGLGEARSQLLDVIHERQLRNQEQLRTWVAEELIPPYEEDDPSVETGRTDYIDGRRDELERALIA